MIFSITMNNSNLQKTFSNLGIAPNILSCLQKLHFLHPTPIQQKAIPIGVSGEDLIGIAQTGTGKTLAFAVPMIQRVLSTHKSGLVIVPTRELAIQVNETFIKVGRPFSIRTAVLIGGESIHKQFAAIRLKPQIIIATPGRLIDHLQLNTVSLIQTAVLVLDEADRMLDMGFEKPIKKIISFLSENRQTMLFSATMPEAISNIANKYMKKPLRIEVAPAGATVERVEQEVFIVTNNQKPALLRQILTEYTGTVLVFSRTKYGAKKITRTIRQSGHAADELHSNRSLNQRTSALNGFKNGKHRILVATDIAARGIDVTGIEVVINYDLPSNSEDYVHRIGRTARAGRAGKAISFACPDQKRDLQAIEKLIRLRLPIKALPELAPSVIPPPLPKQNLNPQRPKNNWGSRRKKFYRSKTNHSPSRPPSSPYSK
jgi:ATP-dependent RNA helicase RhlE